MICSYPVSVPDLLLLLQAGGCTHSKVLAAALSKSRVSSEPCGYEHHLLTAGAQREGTSSDVCHTKVSIIDALF